MFVKTKSGLEAPCKSIDDLFSVIEKEQALTNKIQAIYCTEQCVRRHMIDEPETLSMFNSFIRNQNNNADFTFWGHKIKILPNISEYNGWELKDWYTIDDIVFIKEDEDITEDMKIAYKRLNMLEDDMNAIETRLNTARRVISAMKRDIK